MSSHPGVQRTHSWPSSLNQLYALSKSSSSPKPKPKDENLEIDDASLAHFIMPLTEEDDPDDFLSMSAGIIPSSFDTGSKGASFRDRVARRWDKYVNHHQGNELSQDPWSYEYATEEQQVEMATTALTARRVPVIIVEPTRGRAQEILAGNRERRSSRPLTRRSHSWREPAIHLFTVLETDEGDAARSQQNAKDDRPLLRKKHDSGFLEGRWDGLDEKPLLRWD